MGKTAEVLVAEGFMPLKEAVGQMGVSLAWGRQLANKGAVASERSHLGRIFVHADAIAEFAEGQELKSALAGERKTKGFVYVPARIQGLKSFIKYLRADPAAPAGFVEYASALLKQYIAEWQAKRAASEADTGDESAPEAPQAAAPAPAPKPGASVADLAAQVEELD